MLVPKLNVDDYGMQSSVKEDGGSLVLGTGEKRDME